MIESPLFFNKISKCYLPYLLSLEYSEGFALFCFSSGGVRRTHVTPQREKSGMIKNKAFNFLNVLNFNKNKT